MNRFLLLLLLTIPIQGLCTVDLPTSNATSKYTSLGSSTCKLKHLDREAGASTQECLGLSGYKILLLDSDNRMSVTVVTPDKQEHPLDFWRVVTPQFSSVGGRVEWRVKPTGKSTIPIALIIPLDVNDDPDSSKPTRYFVVVRLLDSICVVDKIKSAPEAIRQAREEADMSSARSCMGK